MSDFILLDSEARYWTGEGWGIEPEHAQDLSLQDACSLAQRFPATVILGFSQLVEIDQRPQGFGFQITYPDGSSKAVLNQPDFDQELCSWFLSFNGA